MSPGTAETEIPFFIVFVSAGFDEDLKAGLSPEFVLKNARTRLWDDDLFERSSETIDEPEAIVARKHGYEYLERCACPGRFKCLKETSGHASLVGSVSMFPPTKANLAASVSRLEPESDDLSSECVGITTSILKRCVSPKDADYPARLQLKSNLTPHHLAFFVHEDRFQISIAE